MQKTKGTIIRHNKLNTKRILWIQTGKFQCQWQKSSEFVLQEHEMALPLFDRQY